MTDSEILPEGFDPAAPSATLRGDDSPATEQQELEQRAGQQVDRAQMPLEGDERDQLLIREATNLDPEGRPHFLRMTDGQPDTCGTDGDPWPCDVATRLDEQQRKLTGQGPDAPPVADGGLVNLDDVASALGMSRGDLDARLSSSVESHAAASDAVRVGFDGVIIPDTGR